jgi:hypothetical protein
LHLVTVIGLHILIECFFSKIKHHSQMFSRFDNTPNITWSLSASSRHLLAMMKYQ